MLIGYRRMSGPVNLTDSEKGDRGSWWEKRRALFSFLRARGHELEVIGDDTPLGSYPLLLVEFGSKNELYYREALTKTRELVNLPHGKIVFLCDDPDLSFPWSWITNGIPKWSVWANAYGCPKIGKQPSHIPTFDFPFSSLQEIHSGARDAWDDAFVYIGRPNGREDRFREVFDCAGNRVKIYGRPKEWKDFPGVHINQPPKQVERAEFYAGCFGSLGVADAKHKHIGWRTGRVFHAILAGCPAIVEEDHVWLSGVLPSFRHASQLHAIRVNWKRPGVRDELVSSAQKLVRREREIAERRLEAYGL